MRAEGLGAAARGLWLRGVSRSWVRMRPGAGFGFRSDVRLQARSSPHAKQARLGVVAWNRNWGDAPLRHRSHQSEPEPGAAPGWMGGERRCSGSAEGPAREVACAGLSPTDVLSSN